MGPHAACSSDKGDAVVLVLALMQHKHNRRPDPTIFSASPPFEVQASSIGERYSVGCTCVSLT